MYTTLWCFWRSVNREWEQELLVWQDLKRKTRNNRSVLYNSYYILLYIDYLLFFFTPSIISFIIVANVWVGGNESGSVFVKQRDEYMYRCDILPPPPRAPFYLLPHCHTWCPVFVTEACTHSSLLRSCPDVCFLLPVKLKHVILLLNYYPFHCLKVSCWKPSNRIKKSETLIVVLNLLFHTLISF